MRSVLVWAMVIFGLLMPSTLAKADEPKSVRIDVNRLPPCIQYDTGMKQWTGFEVELLRFILVPKGYQLEFREVQEFDHIFDGLTQGKADIAVAGITVTAARERLIDFSHPTVHSSLCFMIKGERKDSWWYSIWAWVRTTFPSLLIAIGIMIVFGHLIWFVERKRNQDFSPRYIPGVIDGMWYVIIAITSVGFGDKMSRTPLGRVLTAILLVIGLGVAANLVADMSAFKIEQRLESSIKQPNDLRGKSIATVKGTTSMDLINSLGGNAYLVTTLPEAIELLETNKVDAVIFDGPTLRHYEKLGTKKHLVTLQDLREEDYGFAVSTGNHELLEVLNQGLLELRENGTYDVLAKRFLGK